MHPSFSIFVDSLHDKYEALIACPLSSEGHLPKELPKSGVYLFSENGKPFYVGRSNNLRQRYRNHSIMASQHNQAVFAFKLAREATGKMTASYIAGKDDRKSLVQDPTFKRAFDEAKARVRKMDYRFVEEPDQVKQALLEIYCTIVLKTPYNDFDTH